MRIGRNDPCPCGSGKKYKKCCGRSQGAPPALSGGNGSQGISNLLISAEQSYTRGDHPKATEFCKQILARSPSHVGALCLLGRITLNQGDSVRATELFRKALKKAPNDIQLLYFCGRALGQSGHFIEAASLLRRAVERDPGFAEGYNFLGTLLHVMGKTDEAASLVLKAVQLDRNNPQLHSHQLVSSHSSSRYSAAEIFGFHKEWGERHASRYYTEHPFTNTCDPGRRIKLGYVSPRFSREIVGHFFKPVFDNHDRGSFELFCYSNTLAQDDYTKHFSERSNWRPIAIMDDEAVTRQIRRDGIDILVDLSGHTPNNRLLVFARKPAPIQISWLDYFDTTGLETMDYLITDPVSTPLDTTQQFVEQVIRMPHARFCWSPHEHAPEVTALPALERGYITFGSFNRPEKVTPDVIRVWADILAAIPDARLILKNRNFVHGDTRNYFRDAFRKTGVAEERVEMRGESPHQEALREYGDVDIALDPFPYNGGATTCDALWMGVPVITLLGDRMISRQTASLLTAVGITDFVAQDSSGYLETAVRWCARLHELAELRGRLRGQMAASPVCDAGKFTSDLERVYRQVWEKWCTRTA